MSPGMPARVRSRCGSSSSPAGAVLSVRDDGVGLAPGAPPGLGVLGMQERVRGVGGQLEIESVAGAGTTVRARVPA